MGSYKVNTPYVWSASILSSLVSTGSCAKLFSCYAKYVSMVKC